MNWRYGLKKNKQIYLEDLIFFIFISLGSWPSFIIGITVFYGDIIIYKPRKDYIK